MPVTDRKLDVRAVIFDMDGLMIDSETVYWAAGRKVALRRGMAVSSQTLGRMMGRKPLESMTVFRDELDLSDTPAELLHERDSMVFETLKAGVPAMPFLTEALADLSKHFKLAIATSATRKFVNVVLDGLGIEPVFAAIQTSDNVSVGKPDPEIYRKAMAQLDLQPEHCVVLEDSSNGALAGKRAGAYTIAIPSEHTREQDFSFVDYVANDLRDAADHILALNKIS